MIDQRKKHKHYNAIIAFANGWLIEKKHVGVWCPVSMPQFEVDREFRIVPDAEGWVPWYGGECPVDSDVLVEAAFDDCKGGYVIPAENWDWTWGDVAVKPIIAYRVVKEADPYADLKKAVKDPTKEVRCLLDATNAANRGWYSNEPEMFKWIYPPEFYEIRDKPKSKQVKLEAWIDIHTSEICWRTKEQNMPRQPWVRYPEGDLEAEREE